MKTLTVGEVARLAGITVRTLHHYDTIGLLTPSERHDNGYRAYTAGDIGRLQEILAYRKLGFGLEDIAEVLDRSQSPVDALVGARQRVQDRIAELGLIADSLDTAIRSEKEGTTMTPEDRLEVFGTFDPGEHAQEAEERWEGTDAYAQSMKRTSSYTKEDWVRMNAEQADVYAALVTLMDEGDSPDSPRAAEQVEAHRALIGRWFYDCTPEIHAGLGAMYVADDRFRTSIDQSGKGLAEYLSEAIAAAYG